MKKKLGIVVGVVIIILLLVALVPMPHKVSKEYSGYNLLSKDYSVKATVKGTLSSKIFREKTFSAVFEIDTGDKKYSLDFSGKVHSVPDNSNLNYATSDIYDAASNAYSSWKLCFFGNNFENLCLVNKEKNCEVLLYSTSSDSSKCIEMFDPVLKGFLKNLL